MIKAAQTELDFSAKLTAAELRAERARARGAELEALLLERGQLTRKELEPLGFDDRELREIVEEDAKRVARRLRPLIYSFPGSRGYKAFRKVTIEEQAQCDSLRSNGRKLIARWLYYRRGFTMLEGAE